MTVPDPELKNLPVELLQRGRYQPRVAFAPDNLEELAESIRAQGVVQPIVVRPIGPARYEIIAGERRWRAAQIAGLSEIPAVIRDVPDNVAAAMAMIENIHRDDLNPIEEARAVVRMQQEFSLTQDEVAEALGRRRSRSAVGHLVRLLKLAPRVQDLLEQRALEFGHGKVLAGLPLSQQVELAERCVRDGMSVRELEKAIKPVPGAKDGAVRRDPNVESLERRIANKVGATTGIVYDDRGRGRLTLAFNSLDELQNILAHLNISTDS